MVSGGALVYGKYNEVVAGGRGYALEEQRAVGAVVRVASFSRHVLALNAQGVVYAWGQNTDHQCGGLTPRMCWLGCLLGCLAAWLGGWVVG